MFSWKVGGMYYLVFDQLLCSRIWEKVRKGRGHTISDRSPVAGDTFVLSMSTATRRTQKRLRKTRPNRSDDHQNGFF